MASLRSIAWWFTDDKTLYYYISFAKQSLAEVLGYNHLESALATNGRRELGNLLEAELRKGEFMGVKSALEPSGTGDESLMGLVQCEAEELSPCI